MTTIRTTCPTCGEVDMTPQAILLSVRDRAGEGSYRFSCPTCRDTIEKPADRKVVALLLSAGVEMEQDAGDLAPGHADDAHRTEPRPGGPPFTADDLISFHFQLQDETALRQFLGSA